MSDQWVNTWRKQTARNPQSGSSPERQIRDGLIPVVEVADRELPEHAKGLVDPTVGVRSSAPEPLLDAPLEGPCQPWCDITDLDECYHGSQWAEWAIRFASLWLWAASGRQYGLCEREIFPCGNRVCTCGCCAGDRIKVPGPVAGVIEIVQNGEFWDLNRVRRWGRYHLELCDRRDCWPCGNDCSRSPYERPIKVSDYVPAVFPKWPAWAQTAAACYGIVPRETSSASDECVRILEDHPELAYEILVREECPQWVAEWFAAEGLDLVWGQCGCCDETGATHSPDGAQYVCGTVIEEFEVSTFEQSDGCVPLSCCNNRNCAPLNRCVCRPHLIEITTVETVEVSCAPEVVPTVVTICEDTPQWQVDYLMADKSVQVEYETADVADACIERFRTAGSHAVAPATTKPVKEPVTGKYKAADSLLSTYGRASGCADTDSWLIRYWQGRIVPLEARVAACCLAESLIDLKSGTGCVEASEYLTKIVRGNVTLDFSKRGKENAFASIGTGLAIVDNWLGIVNPNGLRRRARVYRADDCTMSGTRTT